MFRFTVYADKEVLDRDGEYDHDEYGKVAEFAISGATSQEVVEDAIKTANDRSFQITEVDEEGLANFVKVAQKMDFIVHAPEEWKKWDVVVVNDSLGMIWEIDGLRHFLKKMTRETEELWEKIDYME